MEVKEILLTVDEGIKLLLMLEIKGAHAHVFVEALKKLSMAQGMISALGKKDIPLPKDET